ncbi:quinone oxidoreductase family protein [Dokdonella sp.]|uniref:quinone oxidoreductase family protein n=1 Tax=Dokdonella sp. TaxID=2291710 RepID=UPI0031CA925C|nr:zinc-binding alcohol dehydrogenase family protein [Dokdonella sp.]
MSKMKVWYFEQYGPPSALRLQERELPRPGPGEVLVKVAATAINPSDVKNVSGHFKSSMPRIPGRDFAGTIVAGDGREGEEIWGSGPGFGVTRDGAHAEYFVMPSAWVSRKPPHLSMEQAAAIGVPYLAAWSALVTAGEIRAGETVLVTGVSGAVGRAATQIAHWKKARVIGASRSSDNPSGADAIIDTTQQDLVAEVRALTDGKGADLALDVVGGALFEPCLEALRGGGRQVAIASNPQVVSFNLVDFYHGRKRLLGVDTMGLGGADIVALMDQMRAGFEQGVLQPPDAQTWSFEQAVAAYAAVAQGGAPVKHVLTMRETHA